MSAEMVSSTNNNVLTIYIPLLNEGTTVVRPTQGVKLGENAYNVLPTQTYDPNDEEWQFPPGSVVAWAAETRNGQEVLVAKRRLR
jgi:hypothetical protein